MPLSRFAVYFLSVAACAVVLFPRVAPPLPLPDAMDIPTAQAFDGLAPQAVFSREDAAQPALHLSMLKRSFFHHRHPETIVASN